MVGSSPHVEQVCAPALVVYGQTSVVSRSTMVLVSESLRMIETTGGYPPLCSWMPYLRQRWLSVLGEQGRVEGPCLLEEPG
jgi:hypothetical protein